MILVITSNNDGRIAVNIDAIFLLAFLKVNRRNCSWQFILIAASIQYGSQFYVLLEIFINCFI